MSLSEIRYTSTPFHHIPSTGQWPCSLFKWSFWGTSNPFSVFPFRLRASSVMSSSQRPRSPSEMLERPVGNGWDWGLLGWLWLVIVDHSRTFPANEAQVRKPPFTTCSVNNRFMQLRLLHRSPPWLLSGLLKLLHDFIFATKTNNCNTGIFSSVVQHHVQLLEGILVQSFSCSWSPA